VIANTEIECVPRVAPSGDVLSLPKWVRGRAANLFLYPNPASQYFTLEYTLEELGTGTSVEIIDDAGRIVYTSELHSAKDAVLVSTEEWAAAIYRVNLMSNGTLIESQPLQVK